jgi:hypothetical protein
MKPSRISETELIAAFGGRAAYLSMLRADLAAAVTQLGAGFPSGLIPHGDPTTWELQRRSVIAALEAVIEENGEHPQHDLDDEAVSRLIDLQAMPRHEVAILCAQRGKFARIYAGLASAYRAGAGDAELGRIFREEAGFAAVFPP